MARGLAVDVLGYPERAGGRGLLRSGRLAKLLDPWRGRQHLSAPLLAGRSLVLREFLSVRFAL